MKEASRKTAVSLFIFRFVRLLISIATLSVSARYFGVGLERESWILSANFVIVLHLALWGPLNETFRAKFIFIKSAEGASIALQRAVSILLFSLLVMTLVVLAFELFTPSIAHFIAPSFADDDLLRLSTLLRFLLWSAILSQATQLLSSLLNTYDSFYIPEISGVITAIINIAIIVLLSHHFGIYSFLIANYVSAFILLAALVYQIYKLKIPLFQQKVSISWKNIGPFILYSLPFFLPYLVGQCSSLIEKSIANILAHNTVSIIDYSKKISDIIQTVLTSVLATIMVPIISSKFAEGKMEMVANESKKYVQLIFLMLAFIVPMLVLCAGSITDILYNKGSISIEDLAKISVLIKLYAISLVCIFGYLIFGLILLSVNKSKQYAFYGVLAQIVLILITILGFKTLGIYTFVIALSLSHLLSACILMYQLPFPKKPILISLLQYGLLILSITGAVYSINIWVYSPTNSYAHIIFNALLVAAFGVGFAAVLKLPELAILKSFVAQKTRKK